MQLNVIAIYKWNSDNSNFSYSNDLSDSYNKVDALCFQIVL